MRMRRAVLTVLILASATFASDAGAQVTPAANRVRVVESCPCSGCACGSISKRTLIVGQLVRRTDDSVVIVPDSLSAQGTEQVFVLGTQHQLLQSVGFRRRTLRGMGTGLLVGAVGGGVWGALYDEKPVCAQGSSCFEYGRGYNAFWGAFLLAWPGLVIGGLVGASNTHEVWRPMADRSVRVAIAPTAKGGAQFTARMSF